MFSNATSEGSKRTRTTFLYEGKGGGKGKGKQKGGKEKREGERVVTISNNTDPRQQRANDRRSEVKHKMLSTVLPKIADLSVEGSDTDG